MIKRFIIIFLGVLGQACYGSNVISLPFITNDIEYAETRGKLYALVDAMDPVYGNRIVEINVNTGEVERSQFVGTEPGLMRLTSDENYAWIKFQRIPFIRRINLNTFEVDKDIYLGPSQQYEPPNTRFSTVLAYNFTIFPGEDNKLALGLQQPFEFAFEALALYKNDTIMPVRFTAYLTMYYPFCFEPLLDGQYLIGHYQSNWESEFSLFKVLDDGVELKHEQVFDLDGGFFHRNWFKTHNDTLYDAIGEIMDATDTSGVRVLDTCRNQIIGDRYGFTFSGIHDAYLYPGMTGDSLYLTFYDQHSFEAFDSVYLFDYPYNEIMMITELEVIDQTRFAVLIGKDYGDFFIMIVDTKINGIGTNGSADPVRLFPNPATDKITISGGPVNKDIRIYDMMGNLVGTYHQSGNRAEVDLGSYAPGVYAMKITDRDNRYRSVVKKIVVQ